MLVDVVELTRTLVDIPSVTEDEAEAGKVLLELLDGLAAQWEGTVESMPVAPGRFNLLAWWGEKPAVTFSTHYDTVPPFFPSSEDAEFVYGRGSCDAKGILAAMLCATEKLLIEGERNIGVLFVVGEERGSAGALEAGKHNRGCRYLINGEPTENRLAVGTKGALRYELTACGKMAHSAYPELGDSAIDKLLLALGRLKDLELPASSDLGRSTMNIGTLCGGRAPNVIADRAQAELLIRLVGDADEVRVPFTNAVAGLAELHEVLHIPALRLGTIEGFDTTSVAYTTDIPALIPAWGEPFLLGPGTIHVAHTDHERIGKLELSQAVSIYQRLAKTLLEQEKQGS
jgi:acetylornithine deacetylase